MANLAYRLENLGDIENLADISWINAPSYSVNNAIDVEQLSNQCFGDRALERELLVLFDREAAQIVSRLRSTMASNVPEVLEASDLAHTLKGSALTVGARRVAKAAEALEAALRLDIGKEPLKARVAEIDSAVGEVGQAVAGILASM